MTRFNCDPHLRIAVNAWHAELAVKTDDAIKGLSVLHSALASIAMKHDMEHGAGSFVREMEQAWPR